MSAMITEALYYGEPTAGSILLAGIIIVPILIVLGFFVIMGLRILKEVTIDVRAKTK